MTSSKRVRFKSNAVKDNFIKDLRKRVDHYFESNNLSRHANTEMYLKTVFAIVMWVFFYGLIMSDMFSHSWIQLFAVYLGLGFVNIFIAFNIMHDATHDAYSENKRVNDIMSYSMDFIGGNQYLFRRMHGAHHGYVNIHGIDVTLETHGQFRFSPDEPWLPKRITFYHQRFILWIDFGIADDSVIHVLVYCIYCLGIYAPFARINLCVDVSSHTRIRGYNLPAT